MRWIALLPFVIAVQLAAPLAGAAEAWQSPGPRRITFQNGREAWGRIVAVQDKRFLFQSREAEGWIPWQVAAAGEPLTAEALAIHDAEAALDAGDRDEALRLLREVLTANRTAPIGDKLMGLIVDEHRAAVGEQQQWRDAKLAAAQRSIDEYRPEEALNHLQEGLRLFPADAELLHETITLQLNRHRGRGGKLEEFRSDYEAALRAADGDAPLLAWLDSAREQARLLARQEARNGKRTFMDLEVYRSRLPQEQPQLRRARPAAELYAGGASRGRYAGGGSPLYVQDYLNRRSGRLNFGSSLSASTRGGSGGLLIEGSLPSSSRIISIPRSGGGGSRGGSSSRASVRGISVR